MNDDPVWSAIGGGVTPRFVVVYQTTCTRWRWWCELSQRFFGHSHIVGTFEL